MAPGPGQVLSSRAVYRTDPDDAATPGHVCAIQAQGVRAINHSWGISTRNMTAAALGPAVRQHRCRLRRVRQHLRQQRRCPGLHSHPGCGRLATAAVRCRHHRLDAALEARTGTVLAGGRQCPPAPTPPQGETDYVIDGSSRSAGLPPTGASRPPVPISSAHRLRRYPGPHREHLRLRAADHRQREHTSYVYGTKTGTSMAAPHISPAPSAC